MKKFLLAAVLATSAATPLGATVITSLPGGESVAMPLVNEFTAGPRVFGNITYSADYSYSVFGYNQGYGFGGNGSWSGGAPMAGLNANFGAMRFTFANPVAAVLADINWVPINSTQAPVVMSIYTTGGQFLETFNFTGPNGNLVNPGYYGFQAASDIIGSFVLSNGYIGARDFSIGYAGMSGPGGVPEPSAWALLILGFGTVGAALRRKRASVAFA